MAAAMDVTQGYVECCLESAQSLAALLAALQLREKEQKDQRAHCEASARGLKFIVESAGKDVTVLGWIFENAFREYKFSGDVEEIHLKLPIAPLLGCLQILSEKAALRLRYPVGSDNELHFSLEEDGAVTECRLRTLVQDEAPAHITFFAPDDEVRYMSVLRPAQPDAWYLALSEFESLEAPDVALRVTLRAAAGLVAAGTPAAAGGDHNGKEAGPRPAAGVLRAQTITSDAEVEIARDSLAEFTLAPDAAAGEVSHQYLLTSVLSSCFRAAKDAKAVKVRFNSQGVMSTQFILRSHGHRDQLFCEALVAPLASGVGFAAARPAAAAAAGQLSWTQAGDSTTF